jgi:hypothetical protein
MLAKQPRPIALKRPRAIFDLAALARDRGIPAVFWNKDDGAFFDAFIDIARLFPHVFTTDNTCLPRYREQLLPGSTAGVLAMPYQPAFHSFTGFAFEKNAVCFAGSYYRHILNSRRQFLDMMFTACEHAAMPLHVFDRNSHRLSHFFEFRFPQQSGLQLHRKIPHTETAKIYKRYVVSLNVNSVTSSETICSRRLLEILACGGIAVTNRSLAVDLHFRDYCHVVETRSEADELLARLRHGPSGEDRERARAGAAYVRSAHTWERRLGEQNNAILF